VGAEQDPIASQHVFHTATRPRHCEASQSAAHLANTPDAKKAHTIGPLYPTSSPAQIYTHTKHTYTTPSDAEVHIAKLKMAIEAKKTAIAARGGGGS